jgi:hypothetical protein
VQRLEQWRHIFDELMYLPIFVSSVGTRLALGIEDAERFQETLVLQQSFLCPIVIKRLDGFLGIRKTLG